MTTDIESLLQPITADTPGGEDLSFSAEFDAIQEARREEDASLDQGEWVRDIKEANWGKVIQMSGDILRSRSKDLRVAGWWAEALAKTEGFAGLADGMLLVGRLVDGFWPSLYPLPDGEDFEERTGALTWFIQRATALTRSMPMCRAPAGAFSWADHESARALQSAMERDPDEADTLAAEHLTLAGFRAACGATPKDFYQALHADFGRMVAAARSFEKSVDARLGADGPAFSPLREAIEDVGTLVDRLARDAGVLTVAKSAAEDSEDPAGNNEVDTSAGASGPIRTRAQALRQLRQVADFFRRTEPHSPVAYLADKAAGWGEMPLHQWLKQVVKDAGALSHLEELLGLESRNPGEDGNAS